MLPVSSRNCWHHSLFVIGHAGHEDKNNYRIGNVSDGIHTLHDHGSDFKMEETERRRGGGQKVY